MTMKVFIQEIVSDFHRDDFIDRTTADFVNGIKTQFDLRGIRIVSEVEADLTIYYIKSGGTENMFKEKFRPQEVNLLLTSDMHNSLPASLEISRYLSDRGLKSEILHGSPEYIAERVEQSLAVASAKKALRKDKLGVIGAPSDWLISSDVDYEKAKELFGVEIIDIPLSEFYKVWEDFADLSTATPYDNEPEVASYNPTKVAEANRIYKALKVLVNKYGLTALTLRCFDLVDQGMGTGCLGLSYLNGEGIISGCEGDVAGVLSMLILARLTNQPVFMANPSRINVEENTVVLAHCTLPWNMTEKRELDTHFETGKGIGVRGFLPKGDATIYKMSADLEEYFVSGVKIINAGSENVLCRTQITVELEEDVEYFLNNPLSNHHLVILGDKAKIIEEFYDNLIMS